MEHVSFEFNIFIKYLILSIEIYNNFFFTNTNL